MEILRTEVAQVTAPSGQQIFARSILRRRRRMRHR